MRPKSRRVGRVELWSIQLDRPWPETNENMLGEATPPAQSTASSSPACLKPFAGESNRRGSQQHPNKLGYPVAAYLKYAGGHLAKDIQHINTGQWRLILKQRLLYGPPLQILSMFLLVYLSSVVLFALIYLAFGADCYSIPADGARFGFAVALYISAHTFSTVGFGTLAPRSTCVGPQLVLLVEFFVSLLIVSAIGGCAPAPTLNPNPNPNTSPQSNASNPASCPKPASGLPSEEDDVCSCRHCAADVVKLFLMPLSKVRFSKSVLINHGRRRIASLYDVESQSGVPYRFLTFRMVRLGDVQLRDVQLHVQGQWVEATVQGPTTSNGVADRDHHRGCVGTLKLEQDKFTTLEQLQVWHKLDEASPLWAIRDDLEHALDGVEVSVSAYDVASMQPVKMFHRYSHDDIKNGRVFRNTYSTVRDHNPLDNMPLQLQARASAGANFDATEPSQQLHRSACFRALASDPLPLVFLIFCVPDPGRSAYVLTGGSLAARLDGA